MTLNVNEPTDERQVSELPKYIREGRVAVNAVSGSGNVGVTDLTIAAGVTSLSVGTDVGSYGYETVIVTGTGVADLLTILGGTDGMVKILVFQDANVDLHDNISKDNGTFFLNQLPVSGEFAPAADDIIALVNVGGDGSTAHGYWQELYRTINVR